MVYNKIKNKKGFTLIELLIVIVILGSLAAIALPNLTGVIEEARVEAITFNMRTLVTEMEAYEFQEGEYPDAGSAEELINNYSDQLNALDSIAQEVGTDDYSDYHYNTNDDNSDYVFSVELPNENYVGISAEDGLEEGLSDHLTINE